MLVITSGIIVADIIAPRLDKIADPGEMLHVDADISLRNGGHAGNVIIDLAQLGINPEQLGTVIALGKDVFGNFLKSRIEEYGIKTFINWTERHTSTDMVLVVKGEDRRFHVSPGANLGLDPEFLRKILKEYQPKVFCVRPGYSGIDFDIDSIFQELKNTFKFLDVCQPYKKKWNYILPAVSEVHALHCNSGEAMKITSKNTVKEAVEDLKKRVKQFLFITEGEKGARLITKNTEIFQPGFEVDWVDPTGCGDAFCAGVIYKLIEWGKYTDFIQEELVEMLTFAQACGAAASLKPGCTTGVTKENVETILKDQKDNLLSNTTVH
ncbi:carbohydrate kinase family protein [Patescibacteria group bacterium AH-259-L05]|nr:carbohydrate kinase family protein [Patescibacteria group bacterium AH-259-L05]